MFDPNPVLLVSKLTCSHNKPAISPQHMPPNIASETVVIRVIWQCSEMRAFGSAFVKQGVIKGPAFLDCRNRPRAWQAPWLPHLAPTSSRMIETNPPRWRGPRSFGLPDPRSREFLLIGFGFSAQIYFSTSGEVMSCQTAYDPRSGRKCTLMLLLTRSSVPGVTSSFAASRCSYHFSTITKASLKVAFSRIIIRPSVSER